MSSTAIAAGERSPLAERTYPTLRGFAARRPPGALRGSRCADPLECGWQKLVDLARIETIILEPLQGFLCLAIANNGTFILNDQGFENGLHGRLCAFHASGEQCLSVKFNAILFNIGLSADGRLAACQTCNSDDENDGSVLAIFDLIKRVELSRSRPPSGWPDYYDFAPDGSTIGLGYRQLGVFRYQVTGEFTDRAAWVEASLTKGDYSRAILMSETLIQEAVRAPDPEILVRILSSIDRVMPSIRDDKWRAMALKLRGIALDAQGFSAPALECFENALSLDPKIGVKRHINRLKRLIPPPGPKA